MNEQEPKNKQKQRIDIDDLFRQLEAVKLPEETRWFGMSGSWRHTSAEVEAEVRRTVAEILEKGGGIVSGGALNVDYFATDEALKRNPQADKIRIFLPVVLDLYAAHYRKRAREGVITEQQAEELIAQLNALKEANPDALIENPHNTEVNVTTYFERNTEVVKASDAVIGFQVNESEGVADTLEKASKLGKVTTQLKYTVVGREE